MKTLKDVDILLQDLNTILQDKIYYRVVSKKGLNSLVGVVVGTKTRGSRYEIRDVIGNKVLVSIQFEGDSINYSKVYFSILKYALYSTTWYTYIDGEAVAKPGFTDLNHYFLT